MTSGQRREGVFYGLFVFISKVGIAIALALAGFALEHAGYESGTDEAESGIAQPDSVGDILKVLAGLGPAILLVVSLVPAFLYPITHKRQNETQAKLAQLRIVVPSTRSSTPENFT